MSNAKNIRNIFNQRMNEADMGSWREKDMNVGVERDEARADARIAKERDRVDDLYRQHYHHLNPHPSLHPDQKESPTGLNNINNHIQQKEKRLWAAHYAAMKHSGTDKTNFHQSPDYWKHLTDNTGMYSPSRFYDPDRVHKMVRHGIINPRVVPEDVRKKDAFKTIDREIAARDHANQVGQEHLQKNPNASNEELHHVRWNAYTQHYLSTEPYKSMMPKGIFDHTEVPKSQRIRDIFESKLAELRNPTLTGRQRIGKEHLIKGKEAVQAAIKAGKKTGEPFSKTQLADIAQQHTDVPEIEAEEKGGGAKLPQHMRSSTPRAIATKKALLGDIKSRKQAEEDRFQGEVKAEIQRRNQPQNSSTNYARAGLRALFENNYLRLHPVGKPGDQAIHDTLRAHFDSLDPKIGADLHKQLDRHIKMYHYVRETPGESGAHAELRRFEHEHLRNMAETGSQGVTPNDVRQHFHMFNTDDPSDRLAHTAIKDSFYRPKESKSNIRAGLKALFETVLDEARGLGSQASKERQGKLERRFDKLDQVAREQRGTTVSRGGVTYIGNSPVTTRSQKKVSKERARVALKLEPPKDEPDPNPDPA